MLPFALEHRARVAVALRPKGPARLRAASLQGADPAATGQTAMAGRITEADLGHLEPAAVEPWARYVAGIIWALQQRGHDVPGLDILLDSDVPPGAGLSSSAAIECAVALAVDELLGSGIPRGELVLVCQRAENDFVGAPTGILDQSAALLGTAGHALFLDCRSRAAHQVPLDPAQLGLAQLGLALLDPGTFRRVRHIVTENQRVLDTVATLEADGPQAIGPLLNASQASMRDDFGISCNELDAADAAEAATVAELVRWAPA